MYTAMLLADARLPTGGHAYSAGVEPAVRAGLPPDLLADYLIGRVRTVTRVEAGTAVLARHVLLGDATAHRRALADVAAAWAARTPSPALRAASVAQGRGYLRLAARLWPEAPAWALFEDRAPCRAVVLGAIAAESGMPPADLVRTVVYDDAAAAAAAVLKLDPRDPAEVSRWVLDACATGEPYVAEVAALTDPADIPATGAPQTEEWAQAHALLTQRLFRA
ncbi:urease accessory protein UreF [Gordonia crocea]|uniref:Urease accessory protein UreF n=1 Tax=Gordonia crocea TaxID=589162 RepID=A0A7I9V1X0_9ACTN|nr:urease accessory UreF family protein [Gordonia crocea]GED99438.1 urease accessory protein UreF [Gordonia crocea]